MSRDDGSGASTVRTSFEVVLGQLNLVGSCGVIRTLGVVPYKLHDVYERRIESSASSTRDDYRYDDPEAGSQQARSPNCEERRKYHLQNALRNGRRPPGLELDSGADASGESNTRLIRRMRSFEILRDQRQETIGFPFFLKKEEREKATPLKRKSTMFCLDGRVSMRVSEVSKTEKNT
jgi:hypothetical protein